MERQTIHPESEQHWLELRKQDVTSTELAALYDVSPYTTSFELWHRKRDGAQGDFRPNERMTWGTRLQDTIATGFAEDQHLQVRRMNEYIRLPELRAGSSFDFQIVSGSADNELGRMVADFGPGLLEIKNVDGLVFRDEWTEDTDEGLQAPLHIELQLQHQLLVSGLRWGVICALVGGNRLVHAVRHVDDKVHQLARHRIEQFWLSIVAGREPEPVFERDAATIAKLYGYAEPGKILDASMHDRIPELCERYSSLGEEEKAIKAQRDAARAELLTLIGDAEKVLAGRYTISAGMIGPAEVSYTRQGYRNFRVTAKKSARASA